jgi:zinc and cadmium transporter
MVTAAVYTFASVFAVSAISLIGIIALGMEETLLERIVIYLVSFSAGALFGDAFIHLIPHAANHHGFGAMAGMYVLSGIVVSFVVEKYIHWHHHHTYGGTDECEDCVEPFSYMILLGDGVHNVIDGMIIAASYLASVPLGIATTIAVALHEIPQEIGDFAVLIHGGFSKWRAIGYNFLTALTAFAGAAITIEMAGSIEGMNAVLLPFAAGGFIYIAGSDLLPEIKDEPDRRKSAIQMAAFLIGILLMYALSVVNIAG